MNWRKAKREYLIEIAYYDAGALIEHKAAAAAELKRRNRVKYPIVNYKRKAVYRK